MVIVRVVNRLSGYGMSFLGLRLGRDLGMSLEAIGIVLAVFGACTIPSRLLGGVLATRFGCRPAIVAGLSTCAGSQLLIAAASTVPVVVTGILLLGLTYEIVEPATQGLVAEGVPDHRQASTFALLWAALAVAGVIAGLLAAALARWGVEALFLADAASSLVGAALATTLLPATRRPQPATPWRSALSSRVLTWTAIGTLHATLVMVIVFMLPLTVDHLGRSPALIGWLLALAAASAIAAQRLVARWETRWRPSSMLVCGHVILTAGLALWATGTVTGLMIGAVLEGASGSLCLGTYQAAAARLAPRGAAAAVMAVFGLSWGVATVAAPLVGTQLMSGGPDTLWLTSAAVSLALATLHAPRGRRQRHSHSSPSQLPKSADPAPGATRAAPAGRAPAAGHNVSSSRCRDGRGTDVPARAWSASSGSS